MRGLIHIVIRIGNINGIKLYDVIRSEDNIRLAIKEACKDHAHDPAVIRMKEDPEPYVSAIKDILDSESYKPSKYKTKTIYERGKRRRLCYSRTFPDRIIQHCVFNVVGPILHRTIPTCSYAGVKGRGVHDCRTAIKDAIRKDRYGTQYVAKMDVYHFFQSIPRDAMFDAVGSKVKCRRTLDLIHKIIFDVPGRKGLPIGLYSSQILSTYFLAYIDHFCKEVKGIRHYFRYMDDIVILGSNKPALHSHIAHIREKLHEKGLRLKGNHQVFPLSKRRLDFVGFVQDRFGHIMIRKRTKISYMRACRRVISAIRQRGSRYFSHHLRSMLTYEGCIRKWCTDNGLINKYGNKAYTAIEFGVEVI